MNKLSFLQVGDVFALQIGHSVYTALPKDYIEEENSCWTVSVGAVWKRPTGKDKIEKVFDSSILLGEYVVISAGAGFTTTRDTPDGYPVVAIKLKDGQWDANGTKISFYQNSGSMTCRINDPLPVIKKMTMSFS